MKVCFFNVNAYSLFNPNSEAQIGGTEIQLFNVAKYLSQNSNFEISFIVGDWGQKEIEEHKSIKVYKSISLQKTIRNYLLAPFIIWNKLTVVNADIYIASSAGVEIGITALFCKIKNKKFIYRTAHQMDCDGEFVEKNSWRGKVFEYGLKNADIIITQNEEHQELLKSQKIKATVVRNGFRISGEVVDFDDKKYILWVSRCDGWKRPGLFLKIVRKFPQENFVMISPRIAHEKELFNEIKQQASRLTNLKFIEKIPFIEIQKYFNKAKLFIGTSDFEGFPNTYLQACMGNTPIVSLNVNPDKFITKNNLGYCADGNFDLMLRQIKEIAEGDNSIWQEKSKNALKYVKENHNINKSGSQWKVIIKNLGDKENFENVG